MSDPPPRPSRRPGRAQPGVRGRPLVLAVLGGIASGKSTVAARLAGPQGQVLDADALAHEALDDPLVAPRLVEAFGPGILGRDGRADRERLAQRIFDSPRDLALLEGWIHPLVRARILAALDEAEASGVERVVLDVPLLLENDVRHGLLARCDHLVFVDAPLAERDRRAVARRGWAPGEVARREAAQMPLEKKRRRANHVVSNSGTRQALNTQVDRVLAAIGLS